MATIGDVMGLCKTYKSGGCTPLYSAYADIADVIEELSEPDDRPRRAQEARPRAAGVDLRNVDIAHVVRIGLEETIKAHRHVEAARAPLIAAERAARRQRQIDEEAREEWERSG